MRIFLSVACFIFLFSSAAKSQSDIYKAQIQIEYEKQIDKYGEQYQLEAAAYALDLWGAQFEEYGAQLWRILARHKMLHRDFRSAQILYQRILHTHFKPDPLTRGNLLAHERLLALQGLRDIAFAKQEFEQAIAFQHRYKAALRVFWPELAQKHRQDDDLRLADYHLALSQVDSAIYYLSPYALGYAGGTTSELRKDAVELLVTLLIKKYDKKTLQQYLEKAENYIQFEQAKAWNQTGNLYWTLPEDKIKLPDTRNQIPQLINGKITIEEAAGPYVTKLKDSYFAHQLRQKILQK